MSVNLCTLAKEVSGTIEYLYPKTTASIVEYTAEQTVEQKLQSLDAANTAAANNLANNYYNKTEIDDFLYTVIELTATVSPSTAELGSSISVTVSWSCSRVPNALTINGAAQNVSASSGSATFSGVTATTTYTVVATDQKSNTATKSGTVTFTNRVYYGARATGTINSAFVLALSGSNLQTSRARTFTANVASGQYAWYALPAGYGTPTFTVGGFTGGFELAATIDLTNASGYTSSYNVYKSQNASLGSTTVVVS